MPDAPPTRVLVVDQHQLVREGVRMLLATQPDFDVVGEAADPTTCLQLARDLRPDVLLLDTTARRMSALDALKALTETIPSVRVIVLAAGAEQDEMVEAIQRGARGIVLKDSDSRVLFKSIRSVAAGQYWLQRGMVTNLASLVRQFQEPVDPTWRHPLGLTSREFAIVAAVAAGDSNRDIGQQMSIAVNTVKHHLTHIFDKLGVHSRIELAIFAVNHGLVAEADAVRAGTRRISSPARLEIEHVHDEEVAVAKRL
jgi:two-component system, NarL family, nitrate/nitrite response regulator NarL